MLGGHPFGAPADRLPALAARMRRATSLRFLLAPAPTPRARFEQHDCARRLQARLTGSAAWGQPLQWPSLTAVQDCPATCLREVVALAPNVVRLSAVCDAGGVRSEDLAFVAQRATALTALRLAALRDWDSPENGDPTSEGRPGYMCSTERCHAPLRLMGGLRSLTLEHNGDIGESFNARLYGLPARLERLRAPMSDFCANLAFMPSLQRLELAADACRTMFPDWLSDFAQDCAPHLSQLTALKVAGDRERLGPAGGGGGQQPVPLAAALSPLRALVDLSLPLLDLGLEEVLEVSAARPELTSLAAASMSVADSPNLPRPLFAKLRRLACGFSCCSTLEKNAHLPRLEVLSLGVVEHNDDGPLPSSFFHANVRLDTLELPLPLSWYLAGGGFGPLTENCASILCIRFTAPLHLEWPRGERGERLVGDEDVRLQREAFTSLCALEPPELHMRFAHIGCADAALALMVAREVDTSNLDVLGITLDSHVLSLESQLYTLARAAAPRVRLFELAFPASDRPNGVSCDLVGPQDHCGIIYAIEGLNDGRTRFVLRNDWCVTPRALEAALARARQRGLPLRVRLLWGDGRDEW